MTRGIFRLDVSSGEPSLFTLLEVNTGIGCVASESIVNAQDNLFFCSKDNIYQIRSDFTFIPISKSIEDIYQSISNLSSSKIIYDIKRDRLICTLGNDHTNIFMYDLIEFGLGYRTDDSITAMVNFLISPSVRIGYAYDSVQSELNFLTKASHEIFINFDINFKSKVSRAPRYF